MSDPKKPKYKPTGAYGVGYARPPKHSQWQPGQSGNAKGSKKPALTIEQLVVAELNANTTVKLGGEVVTMAKKKVLAKKIVADALSGNFNAQKLALGFLAQASSMQAPGEEPALTNDELNQLLIIAKGIKLDGDA